MLLLVFVAVVVVANGFAYDIGEVVLYAGSFFLKGNGFLSLGKTATLLAALDNLVSRSNLPEIDVRLGFRLGATFWFIRVISKLLTG